LLIDELDSEYFEILNEIDSKNIGQYKVDKKLEPAVKVETVDYDDILPISSHDEIAPTSRAFTAKPTEATIEVEPTKQTQTLQKRLPKLIIVGAKKCGSTPLKMFLSHHPKFKDSNGEKHFFNRNENYNQGINYYLNQFDYTFEDEISFDKTPEYFDRPVVPGRIAKMNKNIKIIAVVCDPVERALSHYDHIRHLGSKKSSNQNAA
jgi:hypothetical protein